MESDGYGSVESDGRRWYSKLWFGGRLCIVFEHTDIYGERVTQYISPAGITTVYADLGYSTQEVMPTRQPDITEYNSERIAIRQIWYEGNTVVCDSGIANDNCRKWITRYNTDPTVYEVHEIIDPNGTRHITWYEASQFGIGNGILAEYRLRGPSSLAILPDGSIEFE